MTIIDAIITGTTFVVVTPVDGGTNKNASSDVVNLRVDLLSVNPSQTSTAFGKVNSTLKKVAKDGFQLIQMTTGGKRNLKTIVRSPQVFRPYDFDKAAVTRLSAEFLNTQGINAMTSAVISIEKTGTDDLVDLLTFVEIEADKYIIGDTGYSLKLRNDEKGVVTLSVDVNDLVHQGDFEIATVIKKHYGLVKLNSSKEYYVTMSAEEKMNAGLGAITSKRTRSSSVSGINNVRNNSIVVNTNPEDETRKRSLFPTSLDIKSSAALGVLAAAFMGTVVAMKGTDKRNRSTTSSLANGSSNGGKDVSLEFYNYDGESNDRFELEGESLTIEDLRKIRSMI